MSVGQFNGSEVAALSPESRTAFVDQMTRAGHDRASVEAALQPPGQVTQKLPQTKAIVDPDLSPRDAERAAEHLRKHWTGPTEILERALASAGEADAVAAEARANRQEAVGQNIAEHIAAPADGDYRLNWGSHARTLDADALAAINADVQGAFREAAVPANLAQPLLDAMLFSADAVEPLEGAALAIHRAEQRAILSRLPEGADEQMRLAAVCTSRMPAATFKELNEGGAFESARSITMLAHAGRAIELREARGKK